MTLREDSRIEACTCVRRELVVLAARRQKRAWAHDVRRGRVKVIVLQPRLAYRLRTAQRHRMWVEIGRHRCGAMRGHESQRPGELTGL